MQLYDALGLALIAAVCRLSLSAVENGSRARGSAFRLYMALCGILRFALDPLRADGRPERLLGLSHQRGLALLAVAAAPVRQSVAAPAHISPAPAHPER